MYIWGFFQNVASKKINDVHVALKGNQYYSVLFKITTQ